MQLLINMQKPTTSTWNEILATSKDGQFHKNWLWVVSSGAKKKRVLIIKRNSNDTMMKTVKRDTYLKVVVKYPKELHELHSNLSFVPKRIKIDKFKKLMCNLCNKTN